MLGEGIEGRSGGDSESLIMVLMKGSSSKGSI